MTTAHRAPRVLACLLLTTACGDGGNDSGGTDSDVPDPPDPPDTSWLEVTPPQSACVGQLNAIRAVVHTAQGLAGTSGTVTLNNFDVYGSSYDPATNPEVDPHARVVPYEADQDVTFQIPFLCQAAGEFRVVFDVTLAASSGGEANEGVEATILCEDCDGPTNDTCAETIGGFADATGSVITHGAAAVGSTITASDGVSAEPSQGETDIVCAGAGVVPAAVASGGARAIDMETLLWMKVASGIPVAHATNHYQFGFVFETNDDAYDDWVPYPAYPKDFFAGTDTWVEVLYQPGYGWWTQYTRVDIGGAHQLSSPPSNVRMVRLGDNLLLYLPPADLPVVPGTTEYRLTAFRHQGNFLADDWNADTVPTVDEGLTPIP